MGADAHIPYRFPSGSQLRDDIVNLSQEERERMLTWYKEEVDGYATINYVERFIQNFRNSGVPSIDRFLAANRNYDFIGRCAIGAALIKYEDKCRIEESRQREGDDWYEILIRYIDDSKRNMPREINPPEIKNNSLS